MINISGYGSSVRLVASRTFPQGVTLADFADDADAIDAPDLQISEAQMGLNGDLVVWNRANPLEVALNVIPTSQSDVNLDVLAQANRVGKNKTSAQDVITLVISYASGMRITMNKGTLVVGSVVPGIQSQGRIKTRQYRFRFENVVKSGVAAREIQ